MVNCWWTFRLRLISLRWRCMAINDSKHELKSIIVIYNSSLSCIKCVGITGKMFANEYRYVPATKARLYKRKQL